MTVTTNKQLEELRKQAKEAVAGKRSAKELGEAVLKFLKHMDKGGELPDDWR